MGSVVGFLSPPEVSEKYSIPLRTIQSACRNGTIPATRIGRMWLIETEDAETYARGWKPRTNGHQNGNGNGTNV